MGGEGKILDDIWRLRGDSSGGVFVVCQSLGHFIEVAWGHEWNKIPEVIEGENK